MSIVDDITKSGASIEKLIELRRNIDEKVHKGDFLIYLAEQNGIRLKEPKLAKYTKEDCPTGMVLNRTYLNYADEENKKATEKTIAEYLFQRYLDQDTKNRTKIIDIRSEKKH